jgi:quercetin dioxygenase-like cupin family protein
MTNQEESSSGALVHSQTYRLDRLLDYVAGAVVSRTLVQSKAGTVTLFAFDAGQGLSEHSTPYDAMVQVLDGETELIIGGKAVPAGAGDTVVMPANAPHAIRSDKQFKMLLTMIRG